MKAPRTHVAGAAAIHKAIGVYQERVENAPRREQQFQELSRDYNTTKEVYASLLKRYEEAKIAESMEYRQKGEQFRVLDAAIPMRTATAPRRGWLLFVSLAFALGLGIATIFVSEMVDHSFHSLDDLRGFSRVPVLACIPQIVTNEDARAARLRFSRVMISMAVALTGIIVSSYILSHDNHELVAMVARAADAQVLYDWGGGLIWIAVPGAADAAADAVRAAVRTLGGHATLVRAPVSLRAAIDVFEPQADGLAALTKRVKEGFDPKAVLNPSRMWPGV